MRFYFISLLFLLGFTGCDHSTDPEDSATLYRSVTVDGIVYAAEIPSDKFSLFDTLTVTFRVSNNSLLPKKFNFSNIQQLSFELVDKGGRVVMFYPYIVSPALSSFTVAPGETKELSQWSLFKDFNGRYIGRGYYTLNVFLADNNSPRLGLNLYIN